MCDTIFIPVPKGGDIAAPGTCRIPLWDMQSMTVSQPLPKTSFQGVVWEPTRRRRIRAYFRNADAGPYPGLRI